MSDTESERSPEQEFECECRLGPNGSPCVGQFDKKNIFEHRIDYQSCDYWDDQCYNLLNERIIAIMSVLMDRSSNSAPNYPKTCKTRPKFLWKGRPVCKKLFLFVHAIKKPKWTYLKNRYLRHGVEPRQHQNKSNPFNTNAITSEERKAIVDFIRDYAKQNAQNPDSSTGLVLSSDLSVKSIYRHFRDDYSQRKISYESFRNVWKNHCQDIRFEAKNDKTLITEFIKNYGKRWASLTRDEPRDQSSKELVLSSDHSVKSVYLEFKKTYNNEVSYDVFNNTWKTSCPFIRFENSCHYNRRKCSHCGVDGHTNRKIGDHFLCPLRESESGLSGLMRKAVRKT